LFAPGQTQRTFTLSTLREAVNQVEGIETFQVIATPANRSLGARTAMVRIDDSLPPPLIRVNDVSVIEGNSGTTPATFQVTLSAPNNRPVSVVYATGAGTATVADNDYTPVTGTVTFAPGEVTKNVTVSVIGDQKAERDETFSLVLSPPAYGTLQRGTGTATIRNDETDPLGFQITVNYIDNTPPAVRNAVSQAVAKWQQVIIEDLPAFVNPFNSQRVDDIVLDVRMGLLGPGFPTGTDGLDGTIANAAPFYGGAPGIVGDLAIRPNPRLPYWGTIGFDPANVSQDSPTELYETAVHEIAHALGFGRPLFFEPRTGYPQGLVTGTLNAALFLGSNALSAYNRVFQRSATGIPMESDGDGGTALVHWDDSAVPNELMTGFALPGVQPLSSITVGAMADLGYVVNYAAADPYSPIASSNAARTAVAVAGAASQAPSPKPITPLANPRAGTPQQALARSIRLSAPVEQPIQARPIAAVVATPQPGASVAPKMPRQLAFASLAKS
jgi:hypothetical protein